MNIEINSKAKKHKIAFSSMALRANLVDLNVNKISPSFKINEQSKRILSVKNQNKNINKKEFDTNDDKQDKSKSNLNSTGINNESSLMNNYIKQQSHLDSSRNIKNSSIKKNLLNNYINIYSNNIDEKNKNKEYLFHYNTTDNNNNCKINNNAVTKRCRHKQVKREIY